MIIAHQSKLLQLSNGSTINVVPVPLRRDCHDTPWCYAASLSPIIPLDDDDDNDSDITSSKPLPPGTNFLSTQVWPSSRIASNIIEKYLDTTWTVCELGCGPGLPSLTAAKVGARKVIATDVDEIALEMVKAAAIEQGFITKDNDTQQFITKRFDLTSQSEQLPEADLYILSDVFESSAVAEGAAYHVIKSLSSNNHHQQQLSSRVWVFAQSDRSQRDTFLRKMVEWRKSNGDERVLDWTMDHSPLPKEELRLFDLDETMVEYN